MKSVTTDALLAAAGGVWRSGPRPRRGHGERPCRSRRPGARAGKLGKQGSDRRQIVGLMQRCKCRQPLETRDHTVVDHYGAVIIRTTVNDPMADGERVQLMLRPVTRCLRALGPPECLAHPRSDSIDPPIASPAAPVARMRGRLADPVHLPLDCRRSLPLPSTANTWN